MRPEKTGKWEDLRQELLGTLEGCPQEAEHHGEGDVLTHTEMVRAKGEELAESECLNKEDREDLLFACEWHDIGKPITLQKEEDGKWSSRKHAVKGADFLRFKLWEKGCPLGLARRERILNLIRLHAWPVRFLERAHPEDSVIRASLVTSNRLLALLAIADMTGRICEDKAAQKAAIDAARYFLEYSKELGCLENPFAFANATSKLHYLERGGETPPSTTLFEPAGFTVTLMSGIPCSGKDRWLEKNYGGEIISRDQIRGEMKNEGHTLQEMTARIKRSLAKKTDFAINATNLRSELRRGFAGLVRAYGGQTRMVYLHADKATILKRLATREKDMAEKAKIPVSAIVRLAEGAEPPTALECSELALIDTEPREKVAKKTKERIPDMSPA